MKVTILFTPFILVLINVAFGQNLKIAEKYVRTGNFSLAKKIYQEALRKQENKCANSTLKIAKDLVTVLILTGEIEEALKKGLSYTKCHKANLSELYNILGAIYNIKNKQDSAIYYYKKALPNINQDNKIKIYNNLGVLYSSQNTDSSRYYYSLCLDYYRNKNDKGQIIRTHNNIGKIHLISRDLNKALFHYQKSLLTNQTPTGYLNNFLALETLISKTEILPTLKTILKADNLTKVIQKQITRRSDKLRLTRQLNRIINTALPIIENIYTQSKQKKYLDLLFYFSERAKANILLDEITNQGRAKVKAKLITLDTLQRRLKQNQVLITYARSKTKLYGLAVNQRKVVFKKLGNFTTLLDSMEYFQGHSQSIDVRQFLASAPMLYKLLIKPFEQVLKGNTYLLLIPTPEMMGTPFEAFMKSNPLPLGVDKATPKQRGQALKNARYLMRDYFVSYHLSATLAFTRRKDSTPKNYPIDFIALAHTKFNPKKITPLKYSKREVKAAASYFTPHKRRVLLDTAAHTGVLNSLHSKILHISTHGHYKFGSKLLSGLLLKTPTGASDTLFADEVYNLGLNVELAVLSSCYSGKGRIESTEGVLGFNRALIYNGVPYIVFSSWQAYEKPSLDFFKLFYKYVSTSKYSYTEALTLAKRAIIANPTYPAFWAGFMMIGR